MLVELEVFSGRPNPRWELDERRSLSLRRLQDRLKESQHPRPEPPPLGYRGFWYSDAQERFWAYHGYLLTSRAGFADPSRTIERFLLRQLPSEFAGLRNRIASELAPLK